MKRPRRILTIHQCKELVHLIELRMDAVVQHDTPASKHKAQQLAFLRKRIFEEQTRMESEDKAKKERINHEQTAV
jgi:hypothetical protein